MNFEFLKGLSGIGHVYENCCNAEKLAKTMPVQSVFTSRKSAEVRWIVFDEGKTRKYFRQEARRHILPSGLCHFRLVVEGWYRIASAGADATGPLLI